ncbi:MAG: cyclase family protein [bacterium]
MKIIDITGTIKNGIWSYGAPLPEVEIKEVSNLSDDGDSSFSMLLGSISGTYLETGAHRLANQPSLIEIPLTRMMTEAIVFKLKDKNPLEHITLDELVSLDIPLEKNKALIIRTGWDRMWDHKDFVEKSPHFTKEAIEWLLDKNPSIIGGDIPCFDDPQNSEGLVNMLFGKGALILAPLVNLDKITKPQVKLIAVPPKIEKICACPCRVIIIEK